MFAVIGGSGFSSDELLTEQEALEIETPYGKTSAPIILGKLCGTSVAILCRHGLSHEYAPHLVPSRANLWALKKVGIEGIYAIGTVGGIAKDLGPGRIAIPDQLIDHTWGREVTFFDSPATGVKHIDMTNPFDETLRQRLIVAAQAQGMPLRDSGVYVCTQGPRLETRAEVEAYRREGGDMIGMTMYPECALARELDIPYAGICVSVNHAAGIGESAQKIDFESLKPLLSESVNSVLGIVKIALMCSKGEGKK